MRALTIALLLVWSSSAVGDAPEWNKECLVACMGVGPVPETESVTMKDFGVLCVSPESGVVRLDGRWSPTGELFLQKAFEK